MTAHLNDDGTYEIPCAECGQASDFSWHNDTAEACEARMRELTNGERGCANPQEHHVYRPAQPAR